jgi:pimeloyl-ACP methyl ester carboxylesterase
MTALVAMLVVIALGIGVAGAAGLAAWAFLRPDRGPDGLVKPPTPSSSAAPTPEADLSRFYDQKLDWRGCGENQCSRLTVPLDYAKPQGQTIALAVLRVPATHRSERVGQLVVNPGGPGASGVDYAALGESAFGRRLTRYFDIVGFDPRGVGESDPLKCAGTKQTDEFLSADSDPDTPAEVDTFERLNREFGEACLANSGDLVRHMSTVEVAKDIDVLRAALGESQLDYLGASYGTFIGATYADLFPTHVRRMVLDGAVDPAQGNVQASLDQVRGFQTALHAYLEDCVGRGSCVVGDSVQAGEQRIKQLLDDLDATPLPTSGGRPLTEALAVYGIVLPLYNNDSWPVLTTALREAFSGSGNILLQLSDQYTDRGPNRYTSNSTAALNAVNCLDHDDVVPVSDIPRYLPAFEKASPAFGRIFAYGVSTCASWPVHSGKHAAALHAVGAPPIVVVGTTRDPATPYEQAVTLAKQLRSGVLVSRDGDGHTGFQRGNTCVNNAVEDYLIGGTVPKDGLRC